MSYDNDVILNCLKFANHIKDETIDIKEKTIEFKDSIIEQYSEQVIILIERNIDLAEQVAYWTNLYRELKNAEGETK